MDDEILFDRLDKLRSDVREDIAATSAETRASLARDMQSLHDRLDRDRRLVDESLGEIKGQVYPLRDRVTRLEDWRHEHERWTAAKVVEVDATRDALRTILERGKVEDGAKRLVGRWGRWVIGLVTTAAAAATWAGWPKIAAALRRWLEAHP